MSKSRNLSRFQKKSIFKAKHLRSSTRQVAEAISKERRLCYTPPEKKKSYSWLPHSREIPQLRAWKHPGINVQMMRPDLKEVFAERFWTSLTNTVSFWEPAVLNFLIDRVTPRTAWPQTLCVAQDDPELLILLPLSLRAVIAGRHPHSLFSFLCHLRYNRPCIYPSESWISIHWRPGTW